MPNTVLKNTLSLDEIKALMGCEITSLIKRQILDIYILVCLTGMHHKLFWRLTSQNIVLLENQRGLMKVIRQS